MSTAEWAGVLKETTTEWWNDKAPRLGASLAYYTILSLAPLLVLVTPVVGWIFGRERARTQIMNQVSQLLGTEAGVAVDALIGVTGIAQPSPLATTLTAGVLLFAASGVFAELQDAMDTIWEVTPKVGSRAALLSLLRQRFLSFAMVLGIGFLLLVSLLISAMLSTLQQYASEHVRIAAAVWTAAHGLVSFLITTLLFAMIFKVLPDVKMRWRDVWLGAALTSALFVLGRYLIGKYIGQAALWKTYGQGAKSLVALLVWVYYSAQILIFGAEFTKTYTKRIGAGATPTEVAVPVTEEARAEQGITKPEVVEAVAEVVERKRQEETGAEGQGAAETDRVDTP
ncbi:MAG TPA: YihY/virulence factor BrkB family protein [Tepidisphaeraceae bacterium]|nr:YihY/virulence factor BrkB family protein [Tepidisphaeraceae bacterium]